MTEQGNYVVSIEQQLVHHAERQTTALEAINNRLQMLVILLGVLGLIALVGWVGAVLG